MFKMEEVTAIQRDALVTEQLAFLNAQIEYLTGRVVELQISLMTANQRISEAEQAQESESQSR